MSRTDTSDILVFSGPVFAEMRLAPEESLYENISLAHVLRLLGREESLWGEKSGGATLHWCFKGPYNGAFDELKGQFTLRPNREKPSLVILYNSDAGFHFSFDSGGSRWIACDPSAEVDGVKHYLGGREAFFPRASFVSLGQAKGVVRKYVREQKRYSRLTWVYSTDFDYSDKAAWRQFDAKCGVT